MGLARLSEVTVISPRSDYEDVARALAQFEDFHRIEEKEPNFDPAVQELTVKAVRLFALADQAVKDLDIQLMPGTIDLVFRGVKIPRSEFQAEDWEDLLSRAEKDLTPIAEEVKTQRAQLQKAMKEEADAITLREALQLVSSFSVDLSGLPGLQRFKVVLATASNETLGELHNSLPETIFLTRTLTSTQSLVLIASQKSDEGRLEKTMKSLEVKQLSIPATLPQNPSEAYRRLTEDQQAAAEQRQELEAKLDQIKTTKQTALLTLRELTAVARDMLDEARVSGGMKRLAMISGYIPTKREPDFKEQFGRWLVYSKPAGADEPGTDAPALFENARGLRPFELITSQQGIPGNKEVDPTPLVSFVFPIFFGLMFGDFGHGIILTLVALLIRQRGKGVLRRWGNIFLAAGVSAMFFGAVFGEFFGLALHNFIPIPPLIEILQRPLGAAPTVNTENIELVMVASILIGIAHLITGLSLDIYETIKAGEMPEVLVAKIPTLTMYVSGVGYGLAFIGAGFSFNVFKTSAPAPLLGVPNELLGGASLGVLFVSMLVLFCGRGIAIKMGKIHGESFGAALANGGLEVFERISQFLSNTISYVRLAIMLLVHAVLLLIVNLYFPITNPLTVIPWILLNCLVISFEAFVVYVQDLRLHIYEFFTKFYRGTGTPFRKILPDRVRIDIKWL